MPLFEYQGRSSANEPVNGKIRANSDEIAKVMLRRQGFRVTKISVVGNKKKGKRLKGGNPSIQDIVVIARQLAAVTKAGLPLTEGLSIITEQIQNKKLNTAMNQVLKDIQNGEAFAGSLGKHPKIFDQFFVNMVRAGEASGMLDEVLQQISIYLEKLNALVRKVRGALIYPSFVMTFALILVIFITVVVVPQFEEMFNSFETILPLPTRITMWVSDQLIHYGIFMLIGFGLLAFGFVKFLHTKSGRKLFDTYILKVPLVGSLLRKVSIAKFTRTLSTLLHSGVNIISALEIVEKTCGNYVYESIVRDSRISIQQGESIANTLSDNEYFPPMVVKMIDIGERTGALESMLSKVADFYEDEVDVAVATLTTMIEPILIIFLGGAVGYIIVSIFLPMIKLIQEIA